MKKRKRLIRRMIALFLVLLFSIESFGAIVSDNDGSAFITKAEFDSLKNDFQSQIDQYNTSIDTKIDGAIAAYLAGIQISSKVQLSSIYNSFGGNSIQWYKGIDLWQGNVKRPRARLGTFFMCWPNDRYWAKFKYCYYRINEQQTLLDVDPNYGGGIIAHKVQNSASLTPLDTDRKALLQFKVEDGMNKLEKYFEYVTLYEAWALYFQNDTVTNPLTITTSFSNAKTDKGSPGTMTLTGASREGSGVRINERVFNEHDLSYAVCTNKMIRENIMVDSTEINKKSEVLLNSWESDMSSDTWQKNPSPNSTSANEFVSTKYVNFVDYKYHQNSSGTWLTKPWEILHYGHALSDYPVRLYEGIPICRSQTTGTITIDSIIPSGVGELSSGNFFFSIASSPFSNDSIRVESKISSIVELDESKETVSATDNRKAYEKVVDGETFYYRLNKSGAKLSFKSKKDTTYYIKFFYSGSTTQWNYFTVALGNIIEVSENS